MDSTWQFCSQHLNAKIPINRTSLSPAGELITSVINVSASRHRESTSGYSLYFFRFFSRPTTMAAAALNGFKMAATSQAYLESKPVNDTRQLLADLCRQFYGLGWVSGTGGSITIKVHDDSIPKPQQLIVMSPSGIVLVSIVFGFWVFFFTKFILLISGFFYARLAGLILVRCFFYAQRVLLIPFSSSRWFIFHFWVFF